MPVSLFGVPPLPTAKGERCGGLMEIAQENPAEVFPAHTLFLAKAVGACVETGRSLHYPPVIVMVTGDFVCFFLCFPPHCYLPPGHSAANTRRRALGLRPAGKNDALSGCVPGLPPCLEPILPEKHALLSPHVIITFSELENTVCYSVPGPTDWNPPGDMGSSDRPPAKSWFCRGGPARHRPEWRDSPAHARIIRFSCDMDFRRYAGAQKSAVYSHNDVYAQRIVE